MTEKKAKTEAQIRAQKKYMENFVEVKVRMTPERREQVKAHAQTIGESTTAFINRAITETMQRDLEKKLRAEQQLKNSCALLPDVLY